MSLLMDALKRAEKARQAEASGDGAQLDPASTQGFSLDPIDDPAAERAAPEEERRSPPPEASSSVEGYHGSAFELENTGQLRERLDVGAGDDRAGPDYDEEIELSGLSGDSLSLDADDIEREGVLPEDTAATLPSVRSAQRSVENYFDGTGSGSASLNVDDLHAAMAEETQKRQRVTADTETQRRVRAVFHAKEAGRSRRGRNWAMIAVVPLLLVGIVGAVIFVFWDAMTELLDDSPVVAAMPRSGPPPVPASEAAPATQRAGAAGGEARPPSPGGDGASAPSVARAGQDTPGGRGGQDSQGSQAAQSVQSGQTALAPAATTGARGGTEASAPASAASASSAKGGESGAESVTRQLMAAAPSVEEVTATPAGGTSAQRAEVGGGVSTSDKVAQAIRSRGLARSSPAGDSAFKIKRKSVPNRLHRQLESAYAALQAGDYAAAKTGYAAALKSDPRSRDAHLGLAAIAVAEGERDTASNLYANLLRLNPRDSAAQAALISLQANVDPLRAESHIKLLLREEPQADYLHFTLGNLFADQGRWAEAQSAYFNAYRLAPDNADYAYNLAVSLDQLSKTANAVDYYRRALELAGAHRAAFEPATVLARIQSMATVGRSQ